MGATVPKESVRAAQRDYDRMVMFRGLSPVRVLVTLGIALAVSAVAIVLGDWQHGRHEVKTAARDAYEVARHEPVAPLNDVIPPEAGELPADAEWRTVTVEGVFDPATTTVLRGRPIDSTPAWQYLAWLDTADGQSVLVSVGWIPQPGPLEDPATPTYSEDPVTVTGVVRAWEDDDGKRASDSASRITPAQVDEPTGEVVPGYLMIREYCEGADCRDTVVGEQVPLPELSIGPHLSYAWQWWVFALLAPLGAVLLLRRDSLELARTQAELDAAEATTPTGPAQPADAGRAPVPTAPRRPTRQRRRRVPSDEEIEDAL